MMRLIVTIAVLMLFTAGCSNVTDSVTPDDGANTSPSFRLPQADRWNWHTGLYRVSEDHTTIERIPDRAADWHINVNTFVEPPNCSYCLMIGNPLIQPDGTIKVKVMLTHPFSGQPEYTGFDVRGTIMFPATRQWQLDYPLFDGNSDKIFDNSIPLHFSRAEDGGAQLLNAYGFTMYLFPGFDIIPHLPITQYSRGKRANGPDPDSTINGYRLFTKDPDRRMFLVTDTITRTYHIAPPEGEFIFGYVVDASWVPPTVKPVTDPATDFPYYANCEDGYVLEFKQLVPFYTGYYDSVIPPTYLVDRDITYVSVLHTDAYLSVSPATWIVCPDIASELDPEIYGVAFGWLDESIGLGRHSGTQTIRHGTYVVPPGEYIALLCVKLNYHDFNIPYVKQMSSPFIFDFIMLQVEEGNW